MNSTVIDYRIKFPFSALIVGSAYAGDHSIDRSIVQKFIKRLCLGKTTLALEMCARAATIADKPIHNIIYLSASKQTCFKEFGKKCDIFHMAYTVEEAEHLLKKGVNNLLVVDDFLVDISGQKGLNDWVTKFVITRSHHEQCAIVLLFQNLFGANTRTLSLNASLIILLRQIRDKTTTSILSRQFAPNHPHYLTEALALATEAGMGHFLVIDCQVTREDFARVRNFLWLEHPGRNRIFLPKTNAS